MNIKFTIEGQPVAKGRPRILRNGRAYTPKKTKDYQDLVKWSYKGEKFEGAIGIEIELYYGISKTTKLKKDKLVELLKENGVNTEGSKSELWVRVCEKNIVKAILKPDLDNVAKAILDALNGIAYIDDNQVVELIVRKKRSVNPRAEVELYEVEEI